jgi:NTP pyrophosphatase (non-canonical NTP hydrolase)
MSELLNLIDFANRLSDDDPKTLLERQVKASVELGELGDALLSYEGAPGALAKYTTREQIIDEIADVMLVIYSIARKVNATPEELVAMLLRKANKWQGKQAAEGAIKDPTKIPFELHLSVSVISGGHEVNPGLFKMFKEVCAETGVKATVLTLYHGDGSTSEDWMTSSVHVGTNESADREMRRIGERLFRTGFNVVREKVETVPWHPGAKTLSGCYFEKHWEILLTEDQIPGLLNNVINDYGAVSRNVRKGPVDGNLLVSVTIRNYRADRIEFEQDCDKFEEKLRGVGYVIVDSIMEYAIHDTNAAMDKDWITAA